MADNSLLGAVEKYDFGYGAYLIGRDPQCDIVLTDRSASRKHARLLFDANGLRVEDMGSTHGTFLGRHRIKPLQDVGIGTLKIGRCKVVVVVDEAAQSDNAESQRLHVVVLYPKASSVQSDSFERPHELIAMGALVGHSRDALKQSANNAQKPEIKPEAASARVPTDEDSGSCPALNIGAFIELCGPRTTKRVLRLESISKLGGVYFFQENHSNNTALFLTAERLLQRLQERTARVLS